METAIGHFTLDISQNRLLSHQGNQNIRPKTMALLLYFLEHPNEILTKQQLIGEIWNSAGAQEHLLFQSVKEIRELFTPLTVIKTHPKIGYQWVADKLHIETGQLATSLNQKQKLTITSFVVFAILAPLYITLSPATNLSTSSQPTELPIPQPPSRELVVLPFESHVEGNTDDWVRLGAMDMMIQKLRNLEQFAVPGAEDIMMAMARSNNFAEQSAEQKANTIRTQIGEAVTLQTKLLGSTMEYQLHYTLMGRYQFKQGLVYGDDVPDLLNKLTLEILTFYDIAKTDFTPSIEQQSANYTLLQAMERFHRGEFEQASAFFKTYLLSNPNNLTAKRYLLKVKLATGQYEEAEQIGESALQQAVQSNSHQESTRLLFEMGVLATEQENFELAHARLSESRQKAEQYGDALYVAYSHTQLGHMLANQSQFIEAEKLFQRALEYHEGFQCAYGQISNLHALSMLFSRQNEDLKSESALNDAIKIAEVNQLNSEHAHLLLNKIERGFADSNQETWLTQVQQLASSLENEQYKLHLLHRLDALKNAARSAQHQTQSDL